MWIIWYGLHNHRVWTQMITFAKILDPNKELSSGWMVFILPVKIYSKQHFWSVSAMEVAKAPNAAEKFSKDQPDDHQHPNKCCKYVHEEQAYNAFKKTVYCAPYMLQLSRLLSDVNSSELRKSNWPAVLLPALHSKETIVEGERELGCLMD